MELIPIIKASLGIFTILISITAFISYIAYKIKDRNRLKPYEKRTEIREPLKIIETPKKKVVNHKFKIVNEQAPVPSKVQPKHGLQKIIKPVEERDKVFIKPPRRNSENEVFNIYNLYSNNAARSMHKLKVGSLNTED